MAFLTLKKDAQGTPIAQGWRTGDEFVAAQISELIHTDGSSNESAGMVTSDALVEMILLGKTYRATFYQTIGGAAQGWYGMSLFNPSASTKTVIVYSIKCWISAGSSTAYLFKNTIDPVRANAFTPINNKFGGVASVLTNSVTYNSASGGITFPSTTNIDTLPGVSSVAQEFIQKPEDIIVMPAGSAFGVEAVIFVGNSLQYGLAMRWGEL